MQRHVQEVCNRWAYLAEQVMHARLAGRSRDWIHNITDEMTSRRAINHVNRINRMAFNRPILSRNADKARAEENFGEDIFDVCLDEVFPELQR